MRSSPSIDPFLEQIRTLPFIKSLDFSRGNRAVDSAADGILTLRTPKGTYSFRVEQKRSYLDRGILNALVAQAQLNTKRQREPLLLLARFVPKPSAERLVQSGVNFLDQVGNMHLVLGGDYELTIIGNKEIVLPRESLRVSPAGTQLLFTLASIEQAGTWTVRKLGEASRSEEHTSE